MQQLDPRVWTPDQTCIPFHFEAIANTGDRFIGQFRVPNGLIGVITWISSGQNGESVKSIAGHFNIVRGARNTNVDFTSVVRGQRWNGGITEVFELDGSGGAFQGSNQPGFALALSAMHRPCRLILDADIWQILVTSGLLFVATVILDGYLFPDKANAPTTAER